MTLEPLDVSGWSVAVEEPIGANEKVWLTDPAGTSSSPSSRWLFKPVTIHDNGHAQGGDWAELVASRVAVHLEVPSAQIRLAVRDGRRGTLSRNVRPGEEWSIYTGGLWLASRPKLEFAARGTSVRTSATPGYTLEAIRIALSDVGPPPGADGSLATAGAFDVFTGFLFLDALIANRDRHEQNWSVLRPSVGRGQARLAPAYDNEGSLGYNLTDERRLRFLADETMFAAYRRKGTAWRFDWEGEPTPTLTAAAQTALELADDRMRDHWRERISTFPLADLEIEIAGIPGMSDAQRTFAVNLIESNLKGICDGF